MWIIIVMLIDFIFNNDSISLNYQTKLLNESEILHHDVFDNGRVKREIIPPHSG